MLTKVRAGPLPRSPDGIALARRLGRAALAVAWAVQRPGVKERFLAPEAPSSLSRIWVRTADGWSLPLWHRPARPGADGAPVLLSMGPGLRPHCMDLRPGRSLVEALHAAGFHVFVMSHRGDPDAQAPAQADSFDFDDIVAHDVHAAIQAIRDQTGALRIQFVGHGLGGLLMVAHMAREGLQDLAGGVTLCSPVVFDQDSSRARDVHRVAQLLPSNWRIPHRAIQRWLLATGRDPTLRPLAHQVEGPVLRRLALDSTADLSAGLIRQIAQWHSAGHLCCRDDRFDDLAALQGLQFPLLVISASDDLICPPSATQPLAACLKGAESRILKGGWGHLDPLIGTAAPVDVFPDIVRWLHRTRQSCWHRDR